MGRDCSAGRCGGPTFLDLDQRAERHHLSLVVAHLQPANVLGVEAKPLVGLHAHLVGSAELVEVVDVSRAERRLERGEDGVERDTQTLGFHPVHVGVKDRDARAEGGLEPGQPRLFVAVADDLVGDLLELLEPHVVFVEQLHLKPARDAESVDRRRRKTEDHGFADRLHALRQCLQDFFLAQARLAVPLRPGGEGDIKRRGVGGGRLVEDRSCRRLKTNWQCRASSPGSCSACPPPHACEPATTRRGAVPPRWRNLGPRAA